MKRRPLPAWRTFEGGAIVRVFGAAKFTRRDQEAVEAAYRLGGMNAVRTLLQHWLQTRKGFTLARVAAGVEDARNWLWREELDR